MGNVETVRTSSSRREVGSGNRLNSIGCMSGIFHFLSRQHNRSRRRIASGSNPIKRKENPGAPPPRRPTTPPPPEAAVEGAKKMRHSSESPRSPAIPQEIRRRKPAPASPDSPRTPPALVARLMGLNEPPPPPPAVAADKRRELLRALEKCDEDLQALTRIIEAIRSAETQADAVVSTPGKTAERLLEIETSAGDAKSECNGEQPSPVSVLDAISSPRYRSRSRSQRSQEDDEGSPADESRIVKPSRMAVFHAGKSINAISSTEDVDNHKKAQEATRRRNIMEPMPSGQATAEDFGGRPSWWRAGRRCASRAMEESVDEVWEEGAEKEKWELGRVRACLESHLLGELVEELVVDLLGLCCKLSSSPNCRKRLRF
ncbi:RUN and SH3 domain-containing protein 1-like isoform X1 [Zingiber officinale]|uniref:RUN and SH3 domain-containing protein 1-like isoform X1 n=1 Tax=Zingiber officinale TaxID=94328 RepID=UPI001C4CC191|nr:RUN and SH3 domain-containing protein 1-like isoform X1 [Zingiber officinale]